MYEADIGMSSLSCFINSDLTHDLANDIMTRMTSTKPYIPFPRLKEKLEDSDSGVQAAAVNIICELARRNPKNYLALTPLKYLGLLSMSKILHTYPKSVQIHSDLIMCCLDDKDESIHLCALDLLSGMVTRKALTDIVHKLMIHMDKSEGLRYQYELLSKIIEICSQNDY
ncbi:unnamed protein product [Rotaria sordida]|uniref:Clathrin/coatomer adaptor adaptin-like N-terminal domain-containing protein n=1 Tax=Rotaria sordida TaxID=392033 RepID=A0A815K2Y0_9BILA|nr:unnamed protein product [Rotaria sordida]